MIKLSNLSYNISIDIRNDPGLEVYSSIALFLVITEVNFYLNYVINMSAEIFKMVNND